MARRGDAVKFDTVQWHKLISGERRGLIPGLQRALLAQASLPYSAAMTIRNKCYDWGIFKQHRVSVPVVVVGNLTVGGTGKTPAVEYVARYFREQHRQVAILSRGYGSSDGRNDEALVLETNLDDVPHLQGADRIKWARTAIEELESDLLVLDDGYQHRRLARDLDIVLVDATAPWGLGWCLPRGLLRESRAGLKRAGAVLITRGDQVSAESLTRLMDDLRKMVPGRPLAVCRHAPQVLHNSDNEVNVEVLAGKKIAAFSGIGNPEGFLQTLRSLECLVVDHKSFPDHHAYQREDVDQLNHWAAGLPEDTWLVTTQKDWVKLRIDQLGGKPLWSLRISLEIMQGRSEFEAALLNVIACVSRDRSTACRSPDVSSLPTSCKEAYDYATTGTV